MTMVTSESVSELRGRGMGPVGVVLILLAVGALFLLLLRRDR